jgi:hypothetical protein
MLMTRERRPAIRTLRGWAISVLQEAGAIRECEEHGWMQDRGDRTPVSAPSTSRARIRRLACLRNSPPQRFATCWIRSATLARRARPRPLITGKP